MYVYIYPDYGESKEKKIENDMETTIGLGFRVSGLGLRDRDHGGLVVSAVLRITRPFCGGCA